MWSLFSSPGNQNMNDRIQEGQHQNMNDLSFVDYEDVTPSKKLQNDMKKLQNAKHGGSDNHSMKRSDNHNHNINNGVSYSTTMGDSSRYSSKGSSAANKYNYTGGGVNSSSLNNQHGTSSSSLNNQQFGGFVQH